MGSRISFAIEIPPVIDLMIYEIGAVDRGNGLLQAIGA
ncbi:MAG: hypothetical protein N838_10935 [Thiohalocapsa sp. PB-PSB1]|nr:MAG: hypothetical protein N838_10935 [Thiohalocapsa sp. PB-PSB1]